MPNVSLLHQVRSQRSPTFLLDHTTRRSLRLCDKATRHTFLPSETYTLHGSAEQEWLASCPARGQIHSTTRELCCCISSCPDVDSQPDPLIRLCPPTTVLSVLPLRTSLSFHWLSDVTPINHPLRGHGSASRHPWRQGFLPAWTCSSVVAVLRM